MKHIFPVLQLCDAVKAAHGNRTEIMRAVAWEIECDPTATDAEKAFLAAYWRFSYGRQEPTGDDDRRPECALSA